MRTFVAPLFDFLKRVLHRAYFWGFALFLDPVDLLGRFPENSTLNNLSQELTGMLDQSAQFTLAIALILVSAFLAYRDLWLSINTDPKQGDWPVEHLILYLRDDASFRVQRVNEEHWWKWIEQDILDRLRTGELRSWGRPTLPNGERRLGIITTKQPIPVDHWTDHRLPDCVLFLAGHSKETILSHNLLGASLRFHDITVNKEQAKMLWPPLGIFRKWRAKKLELT